MKNRTTAIAVLLVALLNSRLVAHDGPDPIFHWKFDRAALKYKTLESRLGPNAHFNRPPRVVDDEFGQSLRMNGRMTECVIVDDFRKLKDPLPELEFTVSAWIAIEEPLDFGSIIGCFQDNGGREQGWLVGYRNQQFCFALATSGGDDGDGRMTYLTGNIKFELGKLYHVAAVYDGTTMQLFVNGKLDAESAEQSGAVLYPDHAPFVIGCYHDDNEFNPMRGRMREIAVYDRAAKPAWVEREFQHQESLVALPASSGKTESQFVVKPYLQYGTQTGMTVMWRSAKSSKGTVFWGEDAGCSQRIESDQNAEIHEVRIEGLKPETQYFYWVESQSDVGGTIESEVATFQTACRPDTPFAFAVISDTQHNPAVSGPIAKLAWDHRPNFMLHSGDLVDQGTQRDDWIDEFFSSMHPLISRVPFYPVLGNHEQNAQNYFDYMSLPDPEYYYQFSYGNADFFMIDSNRKIGEGSEQFQWLEAGLAKSTATWKFVCHHHPPYSSDENDYGDLWKTNQSSRGDLRVRALVPLYEKYGVDIVWNGHIHSYERTWPLKENKAVNAGGTIYMITGGGGGGLETPGPYRPFFQNNVRRGHHYTMVMINGKTLELKSFSLKDELFDSLRISKP